MTMTTTVPYDSMSTTSQSQSLLTKCCCCIPLRTGCFILGYLNVFSNACHTLLLLAVTTFLGVSTHGFDHFDPEPREVSDSDVPEIESAEKPYLNQIGILLMVVLCVNIVWLVINVACLVGLHKKRPGPVRVYVSCASVRLLLSLACFIYLVTSNSIRIETVITNSLELALAAYFILVYYVYAAQLAREQAIRYLPELVVSDISSAYPTKVDKQTLVL